MFMTGCMEIVGEKQHFRVLEQIGVLSQSLKQGFWAVAEHCNRVRASFQVSSLGP
jgi:hypothetical protein